MSRKLRITFLLPGAGLLPSGGHKIVYEYANRLSRRGHIVSVVHAASSYVDSPRHERPRRLAGYAYRRIAQRYRPDQWFSVDPAVMLLWVPSLAEKYIPDGDIVVATAWQTAEWAEQYSATKGHGFYLIQGLETWNGSSDRLYATWKSKLKKIVISQALKRVADSLSEESTYIPNGLDFEHFKKLIPPSDRTAHSVMMLFSKFAWKGSADGLEALSILRRKLPTLEARLFGVSKGDIPSWIEYNRCPDQQTLCRLYNTASIFIAPGWSEGWDLPATEAMMCGAALAATDIDGHHEYAFHETTALLSPPRNPAQLAANVERLIRDPSYRAAIAKAGNKYVQQFTWDRAANSFEDCLLSEAAS